MLEPVGLAPLEEAVGFRHFDERLHPRDPKGKFTVTRRLGGTTGALLGQDALGRQFVQKGGASTGHARAEAATNRLYRSLNVNVPRTSFRDGKLYAEFIPGKSLAEVVGRERDGWRARSLKRQVQRDFAADALLANWDVIGLEYDNILIAEDGSTPYRIDNGGSLAYRAMGAPKGKAWGPEVGELGSLRNPAMNPQSARYFGDLTDAEVARQVRRLDLGAFRAEVAKLEGEGLLSAEDARILGERAEYMVRWANQTLEETALPGLIEEAFGGFNPGQARGPDGRWIRTGFGIVSTATELPQTGSREALPGGRYRYEIGGDTVLASSKVRYAAATLWETGGPEFDKPFSWSFGMHKTRAAAEKAKAAPGSPYLKKKIAMLVFDDEVEEVQLEPLGAAPLQEYARQPSNRARKGDADYGIKDPAPAKDKDFEKKHPRGKGEKGGQFVRKGDSGQEVAAVQRAVGAPVTAAGGARSDKPGSFGYNTAASVRMFQRKHGLQVDGIVGRQTAAALLGSKGAKVTPGRATAEQIAGLRRLERHRKKQARGGVPARRGAGGYVIR